jgi:hypothetical protein
MEFRINSETTIKMPDKCVWCSDIPTKKIRTQEWIWGRRKKGSERFVD